MTPLLHDDPRGEPARAAGRRDGQGRRDLHPRHGRAGEDRRPRARPDHAVRAAPRRGHRDRVHAACVPARSCSRSCRPTPSTPTRRSTRRSSSAAIKPHELGPRSSPASTSCVGRRAAPTTMRARRARRVVPEYTGATTPQLATADARRADVAPTRTGARPRSWLDELMARDLPVAARARRHRARAAVATRSRRTGSRRSARTSTRSRPRCARALDLPHAVALSSGTAALHLALRRARRRSRRRGVGLDADVRRDRERDALRRRDAGVRRQRARELEHGSRAARAKRSTRGARRGKLPKAVIAVDLYGQCADFEPIAAACRRHGVRADRGRRRGARRDLSRASRPARSAICPILSFNGNKIITTSGGGMLLGARATTGSTRARYLATQAREPVAALRARRDRLQLSAVATCSPPSGARSSQISIAASPRGARSTRATARALGDLPGWTFMPEAPLRRVDVLADLRDRSRPAAARDRVLDRARRATTSRRARSGSRCTCSRSFAGARAIGGAVAEQLFARGLCLPSGSGLTESQLDRVIHTIRACA